ncbi:pentapeptide repeat-containing protein [Citrobacter sp. wls619]|uniref:pentapeptide repeat-containing protein n=1 Tax=Citrobacter sp. wls619 TaxID=2576432 RepID=UPI001485C052|nr:pentapeptide repeat-containing protein [Citrobacter sp. wls619]
MKRVGNDTDGYADKIRKLSENGQANRANLDRVSGHLQTLFTLGLTHAGEGLIAVSTGLAAAMRGITLTRISKALKTAADGVNINFAVGEEGGELAGKYRLNLSRRNGDIMVSLKLGEGEVTFECSKEQLKKGLGTLLIVRLLQRIDQHPEEGGRLLGFIHTGRIYLSNVNLSGVNLSGVNLSGVNLSGTFLSDAKCVKTIFLGAILNKTFFSNVDCSEANFSDANIKETIFSHVNLENANFENVNIKDSILKKINTIDLNIEDANISNVLHIK